MAQSTPAVVGSLLTTGVNVRLPPTKTLELASGGLRAIATLLEVTVLDELLLHAARKESAANNKSAIAPRIFATANLLQKHAMN
jgi:hypothetical protein